MTTYLRNSRFALTSLLIMSVTAASLRVARAAGFSLSSPAFAANSRIPAQYSCSGANHSPPLTWRGAPAGTRAFALIVHDPDAPAGDFIHWVVFDIPANAHQLEAGIGRDDPPPQGGNSFGRIGYDGPCPPPGPAHHYDFLLIALDAKLGLKRGASAAEVESAVATHRLAAAELTGLFAR